uniref:Reverse transcriptase domain-containing protein n=1 Tax=Meloidogyne enterolobii TaxID=390850 RepID=A0A6V7TLY5_MELEN|nr:unnamed protein product [Meloidogyne enterolobii]
MSLKKTHNITSTKTNQKSSLSCLYYNCQSIKNKIHELDLEISQQNPDILFLTETWINSSENPLLYLKSASLFQIIIENRNQSYKSRGGGVAMLIKNGISFRHVKRNVVIIGDFNFNKSYVNWHDFTANNSIGKEFLEFTLNFQYSNLILDSTHYKGSVLDLLLTNNSSCITSPSSSTGLSTSDHFSIKFLLNIQRPTPSIKTFRDYKNINLLNAHIAKEFNNLYDIFFISDKYSFFVNFILELSNIYIPIRSLTIRPNVTIYPKYIKRLLASKNKIFNDLKANKIPPSQYLKFCKTVKHIINRYNSTRIKKLVSSSQGIHKFMKRFTKGHSPIPYLEHNGLYTFEDKAKCDLFARAFAPSFSNVPIQNHPILPASNYSSQLDDIDFTLIDIVNILKSLPPKEGVSADGISYKLLKNCTDSIAPFLADLFRDSLDSNILPEPWKISFITPIFKKGSESDVSNYRPIAITSCICRRQIKLLATNSFGFLKKRSTVTQLLSSFDAWYKAILNNQCIDCIFIDFKKAFDSVPIRYLIYKLSNIGIKGKLLNWISNFLSNRTAFVKINNNYSDPIPIMSGIPQGTIIGPVLFLIYINDIIYRIPSPTKTMLFADDLKIFCEFSANNNNTCLLESLIKIEEWCIDWALDISLNKTCTFHIGKNNPRKRYVLFGTILQTVSSVTDLGITFSDKLSFETYLSKIIKKAYHRSILVLNNISSSNPKILSLAFKSYVRPILEYASIIWSPKTKKLILKIEQIQKWFTRIVLAKCKIPKMNYENRLKFLNLESLVLRRTLFDLSTIFRLTKNFTHLDPTHFVEFSTRPIRNKHNLQLRVPKKISKTEHWIINRSLNLWNILPIQIINSPNPKSFWINLRNHLIQNQDLIKDFIGQF